MDKVKPELLGVPLFKKNGHFNYTTIFIDGVEEPLLYNYLQDMECRNEFGRWFAKNVNSKLDEK